MSKLIIKGLDLNIDDSIHKLCITSNGTSTNTRSILYFIILVNILALISVLNTISDNNWISSRISKQHFKLDSIAQAHPNYDVFKGEYYKERIRLEALNYSMINNYLAVKLPILGTTFDINDLAIVSGVTLIFLLLVLRFTIIREASNLNIALNAITGRYSDEADATYFQPDLVRLSKKYGVPEQEVLLEINRIRREHHYNFLCMNEIFNFPPVKADFNFQEGKLLKFFKFLIAQLVFFLPALCYAGVVINDHYSRNIGQGTDASHTDFNYYAMFIMLITITFLCWRCNGHEKLISQTYRQFFENDFQFINVPVLIVKPHFLFYLLPFLLTLPKFFSHLAIVV